jgi:hypothetical protein
VLDASLPRFDDFPNTNFIGDVADNGQALFVSFGGSGKIGIARKNRLDFDDLGRSLARTIVDSVQACQA